jgi:hypothetical protein
LQTFTLTLAIIDAIVYIQLAKPKEEDFDFALAKLEFYESQTWKFQATLPSLATCEKKRRESEGSEAMAGAQFLNV